MAGINKEIWIDTLIGQDFWAGDYFFSDLVEMSEFVENDRINLQFMSPNATQIQVNPVYPLPVIEQTDIHDFVELDDYATSARRFTDIVDIELSYDRRNAYLRSDKEKLRESIAKSFLWNMGPTGNTLKTPVIAASTTGAPLADGYNPIVAADLVKLRIALDATYPGMENQPYRLLVDSTTFWNFVSTNPNILTQQQLNNPNNNMGFAGTGPGANGLSFTYYGFIVTVDNRTPWYNSTTKLAYNPLVPPVIGTDLRSAIAYVPGKSGYKSLGSTKMFARTDDPEWQASFYSFLTRAKGGLFGTNAAGGQIEQMAGAIVRLP